MSENEKLEQFISGFSKLTDENKQYILGISHALIFAQDSIKLNQKIKKSKNQNTEK